jgi:ABC-type sugar transport system substrate-binding protein
MEELFMKSRKRIGFSLLAVLIVGALLFTGCGGKKASSGASSSVASPGITIGATVLGMESAFLATLDEQMRSVAQAANVKLIDLDPAFQTSREMTQIEDLITQKVNVIIMIPVDQSVSQAAGRKVNQANIPLILVNTRFSDDFPGNFVAYIGSDDTEAGRIQGRYLAETLPAGGDIIYLIGEYGGASTERRKAGFMEVLASNPQIKIVTEIEAHGERGRAKTVMEDLLQRYPNGTVKAVICQNDEAAIGVASAISEAGRKNEFVLIMGVDGSDAGLAAVANDTITATVFQDAAAQGQMAIESAVKVAKGESIPGLIDIPFKLVTKQNLSDYLK